MTGIASDTASGGAITEPAGGHGLKAVLASAVGYALDGFGNLILSFCLATISAAFALSTGQAGLLSSLTLVGADGALPVSLFLRPAHRPAPVLPGCR